MRKGTEVEVGQQRAGVIGLALITGIDPVELRSGGLGSADHVYRRVILDLRV